MGDYGAIDVDIDYRTPRVQIFWTDYLSQHQVGQFSYDIDSWGISFVPAWVLETLLFDQFVVDWYIFDGLEKWYFYTQLFKLSQEFSLFWVWLHGSS